MDLTPKEQAERIVMDHLKTFKDRDRVFMPNPMSRAKQLAHVTVMRIIEEIRVHFQNCYEGLERLEYWKEVKRNIDNTFEDKR